MVVSAFDGKFVLGILTEKNVYFIIRNFNKAHFIFFWKVYSSNLYIIKKKYMYDDI